MRSRRDATETRQRRPEWWNEASMLSKACVVLAVVFYTAVVTMNAWLGDDAYITFRTVDNFLHGYGLTWNVTERVQTYTNPLWMFLMLFAYSLTKEIYFTSIAVSVACSAAAVCLLAFRLSKSAWGALISITVLTFSKAFVDYSTSGLENPLTHLILAVFFIVYLREGMTPRRRLFALSLVAAFGMVNRMDTILLFAPAIAMEFMRERRFRNVVPVILGFIPFILWEGFSLFYYGFLFPNTAYAKLNTHIPKLDLAKQGLEYFKNSLRMDSLTLTTVCLVVAWVLISRRDWRLPIAAGISLYIGYVVWVGGDFMSGRFFAAPLFCAAVPISRGKWKSMGLAASVTMGIVLAGLFSPRPTLFGGGERDLTRVGLLDGSGICDERRWWFPQSALVSAGKSPGSESHMSTGAVRRAHEREILTIGAVGYAGFTGGPDTHVLDVLALGDPLLARLPALWNPGWRIGHFGRVIPEGYRESLESGTNLIGDPSLAAYYEKLCVLTKCNLRDSGRLREIVKMNLGRYDHLIDVDSYQRSPYAHGRSIEVTELAEPKKEGTGWLEAGNIVMDEEGVQVELEASSRSNCIEVSLDASDRYELAFMKDGEFLAREGLGPTEGGGLTIYYVRVPPEAAGFDTLRIRPLEGDGKYSLGHLLLLEPSVPDFAGPRLKVLSHPIEEMGPIEVVGATPMVCDQGLQVEFDEEVSFGLVLFRTIGVGDCTVMYLGDGHELARQAVTSEKASHQGSWLHVMRVPRGIAYRGYDTVRITPLEDRIGFSVHELTFFPSGDLGSVRGRRDLPEVEVQYASISSPKEEGTPWDLAGTCILTERGVRIRLGQIRFSSHLEISVDHNDDYEIVYFNGEKSVGRQAVTARLLGTAGLRVDLLDVPAEAGDVGYDAINVYPVSGDGLYILGHLRLVDDGP